VFNLSRNAFEAMQSVPVNKRKLKISVVKKQTPSEEFLIIHFFDNGPGISKVDQNNVFKAFYSTKNHGAGLGLALCKSLSERNNAQLYYEFSQQTGSTFTLQKRLDKTKKN